MEPESSQSAMQALSGLETAMAIWHRRKWRAVLAFVALLSISVPVIRNLPNVYASTATVLVEHSLIPLDVFGAPVGGELETRLRTVSEQILSRSRLYDLITQFNLYPELRQRSPEMAVEQMRRDIQIQFNGVPQPTGLNATIAFSVTYQGRDPEMVAQVTNALTALYVAENTKIGEQKTAGTGAFLQAQLDDARRRMEAQQQKLNAFRALHIGELPDQQAANLATLERLNEQLRAITVQADEPASQTTGAAGGGDALLTRLAQLRSQLSDLRTRYTDAHPDVVRIKLEITGLERQLAARSAGPAGQDPTATQTAPLGATGSGPGGARAQEQRLRSQIALYEHRIQNAPLIEQEIQQLSQDYASARDNYQSLQQRYEGAQLAEQMDQRLQGQQFRILDAAVPSRHPVKPHRSQLLLAALLVSIGAAAGVALLAETSDTSFHTVEELRAFTTAPVLGSIPPIVTEADARDRRRWFRLAALGVTLGAALLAGGSFYLTRPGHALVGFLMSGRF